MRPRSMHHAMDVVSASELLQAWGYPALLVLLLLTGVGSPIPEDLLLVTAGYLLFTGVFGWPVALPVALAGVVGSDVMLYSAGRHVGTRSRTLPERRMLTPRRLQRATRWFERFGPTTVLLARLTPGTRALVFITAGVHGMRPAQFLRYDVLGALIWVPAMLLLGHAFGTQIGGLSAVLAWVARRAVWLIAAFVVLLAIWLVWGREESKL